MSNLLNKLYWSFCWRDVHSIIILDTNDKTPSCDIFTVLFWEWWEIQTLLLLNRPVNKPKLILAPITKLINLTQMQCKHCFFYLKKKLVKFELDQSNDATVYFWACHHFPAKLTRKLSHFITSKFSPIFAEDRSSGTCTHLPITHSPLYLPSFQMGLQAHT